MIDNTQLHNPTPVLWTTRQAAAALQISERTLQDWTRDGVVPAIKVNRTVRYRPESVEQALRRLEASHPPRSPK